MDHDHAAGVLDAGLIGRHAVLEVGVVQMKTEVVLRALVTPVDGVDAFGGALVALLALGADWLASRSEEHTSELQSR